MERQQVENPSLKMIYNLCKHTDIDITILKCSLIDEHTRIDLYTFCSKFVETKISYMEFIPILESYDQVAIGRRKCDNRIIGLIAMSAGLHALDGKTYNLITLGLNYLDKEYHRSMFVPTVYAYFTLEELLSHPAIPSYAIAKCYTFKSYLAGLFSYDKVYPSYDKETPEWIRKIMIEFGERSETDKDKFNKSTGILERTQTKIRESIVRVTEKDLDNPAIKFYCTQNPGWQKGHSLITLGTTSWKQIGRLLSKATSRSQLANNQTPLVRSNL